jgi:hypothetical protein
MLLFEESIPYVETLRSARRSVLDRGLFDVIGHPLLNVVQESSHLAGGSLRDEFDISIP